jgi:hypothetical protein
VFLLNSRDPFATATCSSSRGQNRRHPFFRSYGANLPISLIWSAPDTPEASHLETPVSVLGTDIKDPPCLHFQWLQGSIELTYNGKLFPLSPGSRHYGTPQAYTVKQGDGLARPTSKRLKTGLRRRTYLYGTGILTGFPFGLLG